MVFVEELAGTEGIMREHNSLKCLQLFDFKTGSKLIGMRRSPVSTIKNTVSAPMALGQSLDINGLGFWKHECC